MVTRQPQLARLFGSDAVPKGGVPRTSSARKRRAAKVVPARLQKRKVTQQRKRQHRQRGFPAAEEEDYAFSVPRCTSCGFADAAPRDCKIDGSDFECTWKEKVPDAGAKGETV